MKIKKELDKKLGFVITKNIQGKADYIDSYCTGIGDNVHSIDYLVTLIFSSVYNFWWIKVLLKLRNFLVRPFRLNTDEIPSLSIADPSVHYNKGDKAVFFHVIDRTDREIVMAEDDRHLYFRTSLLSYNDPDLKERVLYLTTLVQFHNAFGRIYFTIIVQFHKIIMIMLMRTLSKSLLNEKK